MKAAIVGAGISGLATAQAILAREPGAEISVFEASARVGGKVETEKRRITHQESTFNYDGELAAEMTLQAGETLRMGEPIGSLRRR